MLVSSSPWGAPGPLPGCLHRTARGDGVAWVDHQSASYASAECATLRRLGRVVGHQFEMGLAAHAAKPMPRLANLKGCTVAAISRDVACAVIKRFEWLGTIGRARLFFGLHAPDGQLLGVVGFGHGAHDGGRCGALVLERGCTLPQAPPHAASFLIGRALRALRKSGWERFKAIPTRALVRQERRIGPLASSSAPRPSMDAGRGGMRWSLRAVGCPTEPSIAALRVMLRRARPVP
jgi:hypothetical protein